jgi:riboflavin synthase
MFTGLIESIGEVVETAASASGLRLHVRTPMAAQLRAGDSLAVNGVCLTVVSPADGGVHFDIGPETARVTTLGNLRAGAEVNLERAMPADGRFGGHFVQGHVDGTGTVTTLRADGDAHWLSIGFSESLAAYMIPKGAIAIDGISLTIAALRDRDFDVMIIPLTWQQTNLRTLGLRDRVNLECDMVGKYVARAARLALAPR